MFYGELGRCPISIDIKVRMIKFWFKIIMGKQVKFLTYVIHYFTTIIL